MEAAERLILRDLFQAAGRLVEQDAKPHPAGSARRLALSADGVALLDEELGGAVLGGRRLRGGAV